ncbi:MAG TPA: stage II sporulation protein M, partial [Microbacterium sp.]|nr:stage II sporulation protein M [Microbacterium sp.]
AGRSLATIVVGLIIALAISGVIEGFVTAQPWPWPVKIGIGAAALAAFLVYMIVVGGRAHRRGETGDLTEYEAGTPTLVAG